MSRIKFTLWERHLQQEKAKRVFTRYNEKELKKNEENIKKSTLERIKSTSNT